MHELETKLQDICCMKEKLTSWAKSELEKGKDCVDTKEMGEVVDMIKDLAEAEEKCVKACYYKTVIKAMGEYDEEDGRMGYDNWRTPTGRFANKGTGMYRPSQSGRRGYDMWPVDPDSFAEGDWRPHSPWNPNRSYEMMGYDGQNGGGNRSQGGNGSSTSSNGRGMNSNGGRMGYMDPDMMEYNRDDRHGRAYKDWKMARKHYTETHSEGDKNEMSEHAKEHMADTVMTIKEIWQDASPELKAKMKADLTGLMNEMK